MKTFDHLDISSKKNILQKSSLLFAMAYYHYIVRLYAHNEYFVEEYYDTEQKKISRISVANDQDMFKYLSKISLNDLGRVVSSQPE